MTERLVVGMAAMRTARRLGRLVTHGLGSCLGIAVYDPQARVGGLLHVMLPTSSTAPEKAEDNPFMFVDTGVPRLFRAVYALGGKKGRLVVKIAGGAETGVAARRHFRIGLRAHHELKKLLWRNRVAVAASDVGGRESRNLALDVGTGRVEVTKAGRVHTL